jgi:hypothetical protein
MRSVVKASLVAILLISLVSVAYAGGLLKGVGEKKAKGPSIGYLLRDDLKNQFKAVMTAYLAEDMPGYLGYFDEQLSIASRKMYGKKTVASKADLEAKTKKEFASNDFTKVSFDEAFDINAPTMMFVLSEDQIHDSIPVWGFSIEPKEIAPFMPKGSYLVIASVLPDVYEKDVNLPGTMYIIFRKEGTKLIAIGIE